ncbi:MAG: aminotransferase-like domain-containing protein [Anaerolineae bacterium]
MIAQDIFNTSLYSRLGADIRGSRIDEISNSVANVGRDVISLAPGCPSPETLPAEELAQIWEKLIAREGPALFNYASTTEGEAALRAFLAEKLRSEGAALEMENVLITTGGMQGLDLACKLLVEPGDAVLVETPAYSNGLAAIHNYGGQPCHVPGDDEGLLPEAVEEAVMALRREGRPVKLIYTVPTFQNPGGTTMPLERRERFLELARKHGLLILEDDPYRDLSFYGPPPPSLLSLDGAGGTVVHVSTFAKNISPGLRVGWVAAPAETIRKMALARHSMDICTNTPGQKIVTEFCLSGELERHIQGLIPAYRARKERMLASLEGRFGGLARWTDPGGGFFIWLTFDESVSAERLLDFALEEGVAFVPGSAFDAYKETSNDMRLCFAYPNLEEIDLGIERLRRAFDRYREELNSLREVG